MNFTIVTQVLCKELKKKGEKVMLFIQSEGKTYSDEEWREKIERKKEEERQKDTKIFMSLEYLTLQVQISKTDEFEEFIDGLIALADYQKIAHAFNNANIEKIFHEVIFCHKYQNISTKSIENLKWFRGRGE